MDKKKEEMVEILDLNGLNLLSFAIHSFAWECLTEIVLALGIQSLDKVDDNVNATPSQYAKLIGFDETFKEWVDALLAGHKIDWGNIYDEEESKTVVMFHSKFT